MSKTFSYALFLLEKNCKNFVVAALSFGICYAGAYYAKNFKEINSYFMGRTNMSLDMILTVAAIMIIFGILLGFFSVEMSSYCSSNAKMLYAFRNQKRGDRNVFCSELFYRIIGLAILTTLCGLIVFLFTILNSGFIK